MSAPAAEAGEIFQRLKGWGLARLLLTVVAAAAALLLPPVQRETQGLILAALGLAAVTNLLVIVVPLKAGPLRALAHALILADTALVALLVYLTGWAGSPFLPLAFATVLSAAFLLGRGSAVVYASAMVLALCAVTGFYRAAVRAQVPPPLLSSEASLLWQRDLGYYLGHLLLETGALYAVAVLSGILVQRLSREQVLVREVLDLMGEGVVAVDARGRLLVANAEAQRCLRLGGIQTGHPLLPALPEEISSWMGPALETEVPLQTTRVLTPPVGPTLPLAVQVAPLSDGRGRRGTVVLLTDLTREREALATERRAERLEATARLSMGIAHEIRNPLSSIRGAAQELTRGNDPRLTAMILRESDRLDRILGEFLFYARLATPRLVRCDLGRVLGETVETVRSRPEARDVAWQVDLSDAGVVEADPEQLGRLFLNLLINAVQAMEGRGAVSLRAQRLARKGVPGAVVTVADTGPGIRGEATARVFEPFYTTKGEGTGLGLALAARVTAAHRGEIRLLEPSPGACFEVWLPERAPDGEGAGHA